jgi:ATPase subunit of ABC transporter with duplicated ATPase domains
MIMATSVRGTGGFPSRRPVASPAVSHITVSELEYAPPGSDALFFDVSFGVAPGEHAALIGVNGVGKSTILRILAGELEPDEGSFSLGGTVLRMTQEVGMAHPDQTLREMLIEVAPPALRVGRARAGRRRAGDARRLRATASSTPSGWVTGATSAATSSKVGGRQPRQRSVKTPITDFATRKVGELSGGERKRLVLDLLLTSGADVLLLDEPDNYLDVPTRGGSRARSASARPRS